MYAELLAAASARMARSLARALRLLLAQLKLLKLDAANARFASLARQMQVWRQSVFCVNVCETAFVCVC